MTTKNSQNEICAALDAIFNPLAKKLGKMRRAIEGWPDGEIRSALDVAARCAPHEIDDADISQTHFILREALDHENAKRIARNAPWLDVFAECQGPGRAVLTVSHHDDGNAIRREFGTFEEAKAAGVAVEELLTLLGRDCQFTYQSKPRRQSEFSDDDEMPF